MSNSRRFRLPTYISFPLLLVIEILDLGLAWIPVVGNVFGNILDGFAIIINFLAVGPIALFGIFEFIDLIPIPFLFAGIEIIPFHLIGFGIGKLMRR